MNDVYLQSEDCFHGIHDFINLSGVWYPFCSECKMVVEVEAPDDVSGLEEIIRRLIKEELVTRNHGGTGDSNG